MTRRPVELLPTLVATTVLLAAAGLVPGVVEVAGAQNAPPSQVPVTIPRIIPLPNSGTPPKYATDPGGWAQYLVFWGILASGVIIFALVILESRRKRRRGVTTTGNRTNQPRRTNDPRPAPDAPSGGDAGTGAVDDPVVEPLEHSERPGD